MCYYRNDCLKTQQQESWFFLCSSLEETTTPPRPHLDPTPPLPQPRQNVRFPSVVPHSMAHTLTVYKGLLTLNGNNCLFVY